MQHPFLDPTATIELSKGALESLVAEIAKFTASANQPTADTIHAIAQVLSARNRLSAYKFNSNCMFLCRPCLTSIRLVRDRICRGL